MDPETLKKINEINAGRKRVTLGDFRPEQEKAYHTHVEKILERNKQREYRIVPLDVFEDPQYTDGIIENCYAWCQSKGQDPRLVLLDAIYEIDKEVKHQQEHPESYCNCNRIEGERWIQAVKMLRAAFVQEVDLLVNAHYVDAREAWTLRTAVKAVHFGGKK